MIQITPIQMNFCHSKSINLSRRIIRISCISINIDNIELMIPSDTIIYFITVMSVM